MTDEIFGPHWRRVSKVQDLIIHLYFVARAGRAAAEYNLAAAGMIEMLYGYQPGRVRDGDGWWEDPRWTLTDRGRRATDAQLTRIIVQDPASWVAEQDAQEEANDVAGDCGNDPDGYWLPIHKRILAELDKRAARIQAREKAK
jgi:hypothetical protein